MPPNSLLVPVPAPEGFKLFESEEFGQVRVVAGEDGAPWFIAKDVAEVLGYKDPDQAIRKHCKCPKILKPVESTGLTNSPRGITIIPESDIYRLIMRSKLPQAEAFQDWVTTEILPIIRRHGIMKRLLKRVSLMTTPFCD